jgi:hypothetical protein
MRRTLAISAALALGITGLTAAHATASSSPTSVAVFGDWPYSTTLLANAPALLASVNGDRSVRTVLHVGDIHSGSMPCTGAGLNPVPAGSNPTWNQGVYQVFGQFNAPVVYTPGDNEWADCHKTKEFKSGAPLNELAAVRSLFFAKPGRTLGKRPAEVESQAKEYEKQFATDSQFVENVLWKQSQVVFGTVNLPGSNNDTLPWTNGFANPAAQADEVAQRTAADIRWLHRIFDEARETGAKGVVLGLQADMWDPAALVPGGDGLSAYRPFVQALADESVSFGRPVLLFNGDSHVFGSDQPLADPASATGQVFGTQAVPNLTRVTVQGSTNPSEWVKLTIDPTSAAVFSWSRVSF